MGRRNRNNEGNNNQADTSVFKLKYGKEGGHVLTDYLSKKGAKLRK
ncbi:hypothetical protein [Clostridium grantii]|nr:hypothetical protein [Clostridium grantii]